MNLHSAYEIVRAGDAYLLKNYIDENARGNKDLAKSIINTLNKQIGKSRTYGIFMILAGFVAAITIIGIALIPAGIWHLFAVKRWQRTVDEGYSLWLTEHP